MVLAWDNYTQKISKQIQQCKTVQELDALQSACLGRKSQLIQELKKISTLPAEQKSKAGLQLNTIKQKLITLINQQRNNLLQAHWKNVLVQDQLNPFLNPLPMENGTLHPLEQTSQAIKRIFSNLGYSIVTGPELELVAYNFDKLNIDENHPARINNDTFYLDKDTLLRTHCTNVTVRLIESMTADQQYLACVSLGNVYRRDDDDATHSFQFQQADSVLVGPNITFAHLKWMLRHICEELFGKNVKTLLRPSYFPFTEPSVEIDIACPYCNQKGCSICKQNGYIEILGAGMVHPNVFKACHKPSTLQGFAIGIGIERIAMIQNNIKDIRDFYRNDIRFLKQFRNLTTKGKFYDNHTQSDS